MSFEFVDAVYRIASDMAWVDGEVTAPEIEAAITYGNRLTDGFDAEAFRREVQASRDTVPTHQVPHILAARLRPEDRNLVFSYVVTIAQADGTVSPEEEAELDAVAGELGIDLDAWFRKRQPPDSAAAGVDQKAAENGRGAKTDVACPACGAAHGLPLIYGWRNEPLKELCKAGLAVPGGAMRRLLSGQAPHWHCGACAHRWRGGLFGDGDGSSLERAVIIHSMPATAAGIRAEKVWLTEQLGLDREIAQSPSGWSLSHQALEVSGHSRFDCLTITLPDSTHRQYRFDVTSFFGK